MKPQNLLIIGNSHTVAPRLALQADPERWLDLPAEVFALPPGPLRQLHVEDRILLPQNDDARNQMLRHSGLDQLPLADYDAFLVIGGPAFSAVAQLQRSHRSLDFPSVEWEQPEALVSTGYMDAMVRHRIRYSAVLKVARLMESLRQGPVLLFEAPLPSLDSRDDPEELEHYASMIARGDALSFMARYRRILAEIAGPNITLIRQPQQTIAEDLYTAPEWMRGSFGLGQSQPHSQRDYHHANPAYGALQIDAVVSALNAL